MVIKTLNVALEDVENPLYDNIMSKEPKIKYSFFYHCELFLEQAEGGHTREQREGAPQPTREATTNRWRKFKVYDGKAKEMNERSYNTNM